MFEKLFHRKNKQPINLADYVVPESVLREAIQVDDPYKEHARLMQELQEQEEPLEIEDEDDDDYFSDILQYDKRAVEKAYNLEDGELDACTLSEAEELIGCEPGELDRFII